MNAVVLDPAVLQKLLNAVGITSHDSETDAAVGAELAGDWDEFDLDPGLPGQALRPDGRAGRVKENDAPIGTHGLPPARSRDAGHRCNRVVHVCVGAKEARAEPHRSGGEGADRPMGRRRAVEPDTA